MIGWADCAISVQTSVMPTQAELLRLHREARGLSLETVAFGMEQMAKMRGIKAGSKKIPRTHASLSRWETGKVEIKELGLELYAAVLGITVDQLRRPPPKPNEPRKRTVEVPEDQADLVSAFLEAMRRKAS
jgi:transcriptional regulator with XRE-family HTH domain